MKKNLNSTDILFCIALFLSFLFLGFFLFTYPFARDESFYLTVPFRLVNGDSLVRHEWHLTQFSSLFSFFPTLIWVKLTGSTEGIVVFSRCIYLSIQTTLTILVYLFFRKHKIWAVIAAILFFTQATNIIPQISYHTMLMSFLFLLTLSIISIHKKANSHLYILAGVCYGLCCICDPGFCSVFGLYFVLCVLWKHKSFLAEAIFRLEIKIFEIKNLFLYKILRQKKSKRKKMKEKKATETKLTEIKTERLKKSESYNCFFSKKAVFYTFIGISIVAVIAIAFFFITGGTISSLIDNIDNLLAFSEYTTQDSVFTNITYKIERTINIFNSLSFDNASLLCLFFIVLFLDMQRTKSSHRCIYLIVSFLLAIIYAIGIFQKFTDETYFVEFPFFIFSTVSYIITKKKNTTLFYCMWIPSVLAAIIHFFSSNSLLSAICIVLIISNTAGVFFVADLFKEMYSQLKNNSQKNKSTIAIARSALLVALCSQLIFHLSFYQYGLFTPKSNIKATVGPFSGIYMTDNQFSEYTKTIADLDLIKSRADEHTPIYIASYQSCWMYLYIDLPLAVHTAYYLEPPKPEIFSAYYKENPDRIPKYIYVDSLDYNRNYNYDYIKNNIDVLSETFSFTEEILSNGILLTVTGCKVSPTDDKLAQ